MRLPDSARPATAEHATFHIDRHFDATPGQVYRAFAEPAARSAWFSGPAGEWTLIERGLDFRVGGRERLVGRWPSGTVSDFDAHFHDLVPDRRIVYSYTMTMDDHRISVSLSTVQLEPDATGTVMRYVEQAVYLDGYDDAGRREAGTRALFDRLQTALEGASVA